MATAIAADKFLSNNAWTSYDFDPDSGSAVDVAWVDMRDFEGIAFQILRTVGTDDITVSVLANADSAGGGTDVTVATYTNTQLGDPDAFPDYTFFEVTAEQIAQEAADAGVANVRYVSLSITLGTSTDELIVSYLRYGAKRAYDGLTSNVIA